MNARRSVGAAVALVLCAGRAASAQDFNEPTCYYGGPRPQCSAGQNPPCPDTRLTNVVWVNAQDIDDPVVTGHAAALQVLNEVALGNVSAPHICVLLRGLGHDNQDDYDHDGDPGGPPLARTRFFQLSDRLELRFPGLVISDASFPNQGWVTNRTYRHPFLYHSTLALAQWTVDFVSGYEAERQQNLAIPIPDAFYMDTEPLLVAPGDWNGAFLLARLASTDTVNRSVWEHEPVPGYGSETFSSLYAQAVAAYGFPEDINSQNPANRGLKWDAPGGANDPRNHRFMAWFYSICARARNAEMGAIYAVLRGAWDTPSHPLKCGNFGDFRSDGASDKTGWFMDWPNPLNPVGSRVPRNIYPRCFIDPNLGAPMFGESTGPSPLRWLGMQEWASGQVDSTYIYPLSRCQWLGDFANETPCPDPNHPDQPVVCWQSAHQQENRYVTHPPDGSHANWYHPMETRMETTLRLGREAVEAGINSRFPNETAPDFGYADRLVPWVCLAWTTLVTGTPIRPECSQTFETEDLVTLLAMLRGKNVPEILLWTNWSAFSSDPDEQEALLYAWNHTAGAVKRVYAARIDHFKRITGKRPINSAADDEPSRLEHTLRDWNGHDRTVEIEATASNAVTELLVVFTGLDDWVGAGSYRFFVEASTDVRVTRCMLLAWDFLGPNGGAWVVVKGADPDTRTAYNCATDDIPGTDHSTRRQFVLNRGGGQRFVSPDDGSMMTKLVHLGTGAFVSKYDLVQVVPSISSIGDGTGDQIVQADVDYDNSVSGADLAQFMELWLAGEPGADANLDGQVDAADLAKFLANFTSGT